MITENDKRKYPSEFAEEFKESALKAMNYIRENFMNYAQPPEIRGYSNTFSPYKIRNVFDELILQDGFEIDATTIRHAHGIGNNNKWDVVDKDLNKVGDFYANDNMYQGVALGVQIQGETIDRFEINSGGFIRE